ncbi:DUF6270 domain-containing protein [Janibacter sp. DB-40]|uniref:DUF6270 domain-containing protein n=1 Tax=Janibacter sp. DB-40 TaxID=3028808 RepID=UPI00240690DE|nr:DUF6270 domain-containing protein [Janibacter sp. DB-40]
MRAWESVQDFLAGSLLEVGVDIIRLPSGDHLDVLVGGEGDLEGGCLPVFFSGALRGRQEIVPPVFSGANLSRVVGGRYLALSDSLVAAEDELTLGWYGGRAGDGAQEVIAAILEHAHRIFAYEPLLVGGSGGGYAVLDQLRRARVPTAGLVWNPQTDVLGYLPQSVEQYLTRALALTLGEYRAMPEVHRRARATEAGIDLSVVGSTGSPVATRLLVLQNATDTHVAHHMGPYLDQSTLTEGQDGLWSRPGEAWLISDMGSGHDPPSRDTLEEALRRMCHPGVDPIEVARELRRSQLAPTPDRQILPVDLRGTVDDPFSVMDVRGTQDECGMVRLWMDRSEGLPETTEVEVDLSAPSGAWPRPITDRGLAFLSQDTDVISVRARDAFGHALGETSLRLGRGHEHPRVLIVGSCVSRDVIPFAHPEPLIVGYEARQSLISAFSAAGPVPAEVAGLSSAFQRRMLEADHGSTLPDRVRDLASSADLLVWDIVDERLGVRVHDDGTITTDTVERRALRGDGAVRSGTRHVPFGSHEHRALFRAALENWRELLEETGLLRRTVLLAPPWAMRTTSGSPTQPSFGVSAEEGNAVSAHYLELIHEVVGVDVVGVDVATRAGESHRWGPAPFHFDEATESALAKEVVARMPGAPDLGGLTRSMSGASVSVGPGFEGSLVVVTALPAGAKVAYHLFRGGTRVSMQGYGPQRPHTFWRLGPGSYRVRAFVLHPDGRREAVTSVPVTIA